MSELEEVYQRWKNAPNRGPASYNYLREAQKVVNRGDPNDYKWVKSALESDEMIFFCDRLFENQPVPKALLKPMIKAAVRTIFIRSNILRSCVETYGSAAVVTELHQLHRRNELTDDGLKVALQWTERLPRRIRSSGLRNSLLSAKREAGQGLSLLEKFRGFFGLVKSERDEVGNNVNKDS